MFKKLFQCMGLSSLVLLVNYNDLLNFGENSRFHAPYSLFGICLAQLIAILVLGLALFLVRIAVERTRYREWVRLLLMIVAPPYLVERCRPLIPFPIRGGLLIAIAVLWAAILLLFLLQFRKLYKLTIEVGDAVGIFAGVFCVFSLVQIVTVMRWRPGPQVIRAAWQSGVQPPRDHARVVWIVFDELSEDQVFDHRAHDLTLRNFDALRSQSTLYTNMQPAGFKTTHVIPSLFTGRTVDDLHFGLDNKLTVHYAGQRGFQSIDGRGTVFQDAQRAGWRTAIVGWYNPYCAIYGDALDSCYWSFLDRVGLDMAPDDSVWTDVKKPFTEIATQIYSPALLDRSECDLDVERHLKSEIDLEEHATNLLQQDQADFIFLHFAIPHSPNVWSRVNSEYAHECGSSYLDNLALTDRTLGALMAVLQSSPRWKDTTVIVEGDHSWRLMLWDWLPSWTDEDRQASRGGFDPRPALLIHSAGQTQAATDGRALSLLFVHRALEDVVHGKAVQAPPEQTSGQAVAVSESGVPSS